MKSFFKTILAVIIGLLLFGVLSMMFLGGFVTALGGSQPVLPKNGVLQIDMSKVIIGEQTTEQFDINSIKADAPVTIGIRDAVGAVKAAASDTGVKFIYLKTDGSMTGGAHLEEFRKALADFRMSGKPVISYIESPSTGSYYLASVADKVYMTCHPGASTEITGVGSQMIFLKDLLDRLGVKVQLIRHGKYKSAGEMFVRSEASPENLEQYQVMVKSMWDGYASEIARSRGIGVDDLNRAIDELRLCLPEDFVKESLVDSLMDRSTLKQRLADLAVVGKWDDVKMIPFADYAKAKAQLPARSGKKIAVIFADGDIVDGTDIQNVAGDRFASIIAKVRADSTVKAVVLRVNSPGGSVLASEKIKSELDQLQKIKPLVASYGEYAASGGYWISNACDKIFSDASTLTGSIGVFGMIPDFSGTLKNVAHVNIQSITSNKHGDMFSLTRPMDNAEVSYMQRSIEDIYETFVSYVAAGRSLDPDYVDSIGQGRVWTGSDALRIGLVDEIGTLEDAIAWAAVAAGEPDVNAWGISEYPKPATTIETIMASLGGEDPELENIFAGTSLEAPADALLRWNKDCRTKKTGRIFARLPFNMVVE